jgi:CD109 antigen
LAFQDFFIKLQLPYSIKQGEDFALKATVYNYLGQDVNVAITLKNDAKFTVQLSGSGDKRSISSDSAHTETWIIRAIESGVIPINVRAVVDGNLAGDEIERLLIVKPEGIPLSHTQNNLIQNDDVIDSNVPFPPNTVSGSKRIEVRFFANVLANTLDNIDQLLKMPYGCGEQNMYNFAPAVFIYDYLNQIDALDKKIEEKARRIIETGYQRELKYRHGSGGYSAFGDNSYSKRNASTVLTSFVAKCFSAANRLVDDEIIDDRILNTDLDWLSSRIGRDGHVKEDGAVFSSQLMGAMKKDGNVAITAYTAIVFAEASNSKKLDEKYSDALDSMITFLVESLNKENISTHTLAMINYVLHLVDHAQKSDSMRIIMNRKEDRVGYYEWLLPDKYSNEEKPSIEIASYVLLAYQTMSIEEGAIDLGLPVFTGIQRQLTDLGGFSTTQDTVIGIQAMALFAKFLATDDINTSINIETLDSSGSASSVGEAIQITTEDSLIVKIKNIKVDDNVEKVRVTSRGSGNIYTQIIQHYYVSENEVQPFSVQFEFADGIKRRDTTSDDRDFCVKISAKANDDDTGTGMTLLMVEHPSGYGFKSFKDENDEVQRQESDGEKTTLYYNNMQDERNVIVCLQYIQQVANPKPIFVSVQDYYQSNLQSDTKVELTSRQNESACNLCGCACADQCAGELESSCEAQPVAIDDDINSKIIDYN